MGHNCDWNCGCKTAVQGERSIKKGMQSTLEGQQLPDDGGSGFNPILIGSVNNGANPSTDI